MRVTLTLRVVHERESPGDMDALMPIPPEFGLRTVSGSQARIETRIEPPAAVAATSGEVARYAAWLGGRVEAMLRQAPCAAAEAALTVALEVPDPGG